MMDSYEMRRDEERWAHHEKQERYEGEFPSEQDIDNDRIISCMIEFAKDGNNLNKDCCKCTMYSEIEEGVMYCDILKKDPFHPQQQSDNKELAIKYIRDNVI